MPLFYQQKYTITHMHTCTYSQARAEIFPRFNMKTKRSFQRGQRIWVQNAFPLYYFYFRWCYVREQQAASSQALPFLSVCDSCHFIIMIIIIIFKDEKELCGSRREEAKGTRRWENKIDGMGSWNTAKSNLICVGTLFICSNDICLNDCIQFLCMSVSPVQSVKIGWSIKSSGSRYVYGIERIAKSILYGFYIEMNTNVTKKNMIKIINNNHKSSILTSFTASFNHI